MEWGFIHLHYHGCLCTHISVKFNRCIINITNFYRLWIIWFAFHLISYLFFPLFSMQSAWDEPKMLPLLSSWIQFLTLFPFLNKSPSKCNYQNSFYALLYLQYCPNSSCRLNSIGLIKLSRIYISIIFVSVENVSIEINCRLSFWMEGAEVDFWFVIPTNPSKNTSKYFLESWVYPCCLHSSENFYLILCLFFIVLHRNI